MTATGFVSLVFSLFGSQKTTIGSLSLDALLTEVNSYDSVVTDYPVEEGAPISDHISPSVEKLSLTGVVTGAGVSLFDAGGKIKMIAAKEAIKQIYEQQVPITIETGMEVYSDFAMETCQVKRGNSLEKLEVSMTFKKIRFAIPEETDMPPEKVSDKPSGKGKGKKSAQGKSAKGKAGKTQTNAGKVKTKSVTPKEKKKIHQSTLGHQLPALRGSK